MRRGGAGVAFALPFLALLGWPSVLASRAETPMGEAAAEVGELLMAVTADNGHRQHNHRHGGHQHISQHHRPQGFRRSTGHGPRSEDMLEVKGRGTPGEFSLYIFAMSWKPEWCYHSRFPGCKAPRQFWEDNLTIHGLWPDYGDGTYPTSCTTEAYDHDRVVDAIGLDTLETVWPNIQVSETGGKKYDSFWEHEWTKHGTCTGLSQEEYFSATVALLQERFKTPSTLADNVGGKTTRGAVEDAYGGDGMAVLNCDGDVHLNQVFLCLEPDSNTGLPGEQVACPAAVVAHDDSCGQDTLEIASF